MQILIDIKKINNKKEKPTEFSEHDFERLDLLKLLLNLEKSGYQINTLYGRVIFNVEKNEAIDCGEPGKSLPVAMDLVDSIFKTGGKLALIQTEEKKVIFLDSYFLAINMCSRKKVKPLSSSDVNDNFDSLIKKEDEQLLNKLYRNQYKISDKKFI